MLRPLLTFSIGIYCQARFAASVSPTGERTGLWRPITMLGRQNRNLLPLVACSLALHRGDILRGQTRAPSLVSKPIKTGNGTGKMTCGFLHIQASRWVFFQTRGLTPTASIPNQSKLGLAIEYFWMRKISVV